MGATPVGISGSRAAAVVGLGRFTSRVKAWAEARQELGLPIEGEIPPRPDVWNLANIEEGKYAPIRVGLGAEKAIAKHLMELLQLEGAQEDFDRYFENAAAIPGMPLTCHTDLTVLHKKVGRIYEIKTADALTFSRWQDSDGRLAIPTDVRIQLHHQTMVLEDVMTHLRGNVYAYAVVLFLPFGAVEMERELHQAVPGCKEGGEAAYINPDGKVAAFFTEFLAENSSLLKIIEAPPLAQEVRDSLLADYKDFAKAVQDNTPPPAESVKDISFLLPGVSGEVEATEQQRELWGEYRHLTQEVHILKARLDEIKVDLMEGIQTEDVKAVDDGTRDLVMMAGAYKVLRLSRKPGKNPVLRVNGKGVH